jgi:hypothetical protein
MPRLVPAVLAVVLLAAALAGPAALGQEATPAPPAETHPLVGSWRVEVTVDGNPPLALPNLASFTADGVAVVSAPPLLPELPGSPARDAFSTGHGAWRATGPDTARVTFAFLVVGPGGVLASVNTVRGDLAVDPDGNAYAGAFTLAIDDADGNRIGAGSGSWRATRIAAE